MERPNFTVLLPTWLFTTRDLGTLKSRIQEAIAAGESPITEAEQICLNSLDIEIAFRNTPEYKAATILTSGTPHA